MSASWWVPVPHVLLRRVTTRPQIGRSRRGRAPRRRSRERRGKTLRRPPCTRRSVRLRRRRNARGARRAARFPTAGVSFARRREERRRRRGVRDRPPEAFSGATPPRGRRPPTAHRLVRWRTRKRLSRNPPTQDARDPHPAEAVHLPPRPPRGTRDMYPRSTRRHPRTSPRRIPNRRGTRGRGPASRRRLRPSFVENTLLKCTRFRRRPARRCRAWASIRTETIPSHALCRIATYPRVFPSMRCRCGHPRRTRLERNLGASKTTENSFSSTSDGALKPAKGFAVIVGARRRHPRPLLDPMEIPDTEKARKALKVGEIRGLLEEAGLDATGTKPALLERLEEVRKLFESRSRRHGRTRHRSTTSSDRPSPAEADRVPPRVALP